MKKCCLCREKAGVMCIKKKLDLWVCKDCAKDLAKKWEDLVDKEMNGGKK